MKYLLNIEGSLERYIGHVINRFAIVVKKYPGDFKDLKHLIRSCLALHNIEYHSDLVRRKIFNKNEEEWNDLITEKQVWLGEEIFPILSQRELERRNRQKETEADPESLRSWTIEV